MNGAHPRWTVTQWVRDKLWRLSTSIITEWGVVGGEEKQENIRLRETILVIVYIES